MRIPIKPNGRRAMPFYWWRRFRTHKSLPYKASLLNKIKNGDFEYPEYFQQAEWELIWMKEEQDDFIQNYKGNDPEQDRLYLDIELRARKRYNKLFEDGMKTEFDRIEDFKTKLCKEFKFNIEKLVVIMDEFEGATEDLYYHIAKLKGYNISNVKTLNKWGISSAG